MWDYKEARARDSQAETIEKPLLIEQVQSSNASMESPSMDKGQLEKEQIRSALAFTEVAASKECSLRFADELSNCIKENKTNQIDYPAIFRSGIQTLVFAEAHGAKEHKRELIDSLESLKGAGVTHLVLEQMPSSKQQLVGKFKEGSISRSELTKEISDSWGWAPESYVQLIEAALGKGINVVFMDNDPESIDLSLPNWQQLELEARQRRETHWLDIFETIFKENQNAKALVLVGMGHSEVGGRTQPLQEQLATKGIVPGVITFEGGDFFYRSNLTEAASLANLKKDRFVVKTKPTDSPTQSIFHIHLPETDSPITLAFPD